MTGRKSSGSFSKSSDEFRRLNHISSVRRYLQLSAGEAAEEMKRRRAAKRATPPSPRARTVRLEARSKDLLAQLGEGLAVRRLGHVEELEDAADAVGLELLEDRVEVARLGAPELDLDVRRRVQARLEERLGVLLEDVLDLLRPRDDGALEEVDAVLRVRAGSGRLRRAATPWRSLLPL